MKVQYDRIIFGAGLYGLYSALFSGRKGERVLVLEYDDNAFKRATFINQARVHMGYHYPRSYATAIKSAGYFNRFNKDYGFCILDKFDQVYATSSEFSWSNASQFKKFCEAAHIRCDEVSVSKYFNEGYCDGAFLTEEYTYDARILKTYFLEELKKYPNVEIEYGCRLKSIENNGKEYEICLDDGRNTKSDFVLNSTYASVNQIIEKLFGEDVFLISNMSYAKLFYVMSMRS